MIVPSDRAMEGCGGLDDVCCDELWCLVSISLVHSRASSARAEARRGFHLARDRTRVRVLNEKHQPITFRVITMSMTEPSMNPSTSTPPPPFAARNASNLHYQAQQLSCLLHLLAVFTLAIHHNGSSTNIRPVRAINTQIHHTTFIDEQMRPVPQSAKMPFLILPPSSTVSQTPLDDRLSLPTIFIALRNPSATSERRCPRHKHCRNRSTAKLAT